MFVCGLAFAENTEDTVWWATGKWAWRSCIIGKALSKPKAATPLESKQQASIDANIEERMVVAIWERALSKRSRAQRGMYPQGWYAICSLCDNNYSVGHGISWIKYFSVSIMQWESINQSINHWTSCVEVSSYFVFLCLGTGSGKRCRRTPALFCQR
jgi:hypothetical protein